MFELPLVLTLLITKKQIIQTLLVYKTIDYLTT